MTNEQIRDMFRQAAEVLETKEMELCAIDAETGDGDHGIAAAAVAKAIREVCDGKEPKDADVFFSDLCMAVMRLNGGSCIPLCANMFDQMAEACMGMEDSPQRMKAAFAGALEGIGFISDAKPGQKTMVDALSPAVEAAQLCTGDEKEILHSAAKAARSGSEATRNMIAQYGRAKNLKEDSLGHLDAGSVTIAIFLEAMSAYADANV